ncbi:MAG: hypothetical protein M1823_003412 [Watsoniomyces obsoletus]|nr:MAG: hypothetical protein M1823_003412 [Watsoniomyces obsoletus]
MMTMAMGHRLYLAPVKDINPQKILDIGTGTGIWSVEMGDEYPSAVLEDEWVPGDNYDYIHCRYMCGAIRNWPALVRNCYKHLKPGGWVEFQDFDLLYRSDNESLRSEHQLLYWDKQFLEGVNRDGKDPSPGPKLKGTMAERPRSGKPKKLGLYNHWQIDEGLEAFSLALFTRVLKWSPEEIQVLLAKVRNDLKDPTIHAYINFHVVYGHKPDGSVVE